MAAPPIEDERTARIVALLVSSDEALQEWTDPKGGSMAERSQSGPGPAELRPCHHCEGVCRVVGTRKCNVCWNGEARPHACSPCPTCEERGKLWYDPMLNETRPVDAPPPREKRQEGGQRARRRRGGSRSDLADQAHLWERARRRHDAGTSRRALRLALEQLRETDAYAYSMVRACYIEQRYGDPANPRVNSTSALTIGRGLRQLSDLMPDVIHLPQTLEQRMNGKARERMAQKLVAEGVSRRETARTLGVRRGALAAMLRR